MSNTSGRVLINQVMRFWWISTTWFWMWLIILLSHAYFAMLLDKAIMLEWWVEVVIRVNLDDFQEKTIPTNSVIDVALLGSNKEPISLYHIMVISCTFWWKYPRFIMSLRYKLIFLISAIYLLLWVALWTKIANLVSGLK